MLLWYDLTEGKIYDIIILDVEMQGLSGTDLAAQLRELFPDIFLIFVASEKYVYDIFRYRTHRFIPKCQLHIRLEEAIFSACNEIISTTGHCYMIKTGIGEERVSINRILKITRDGNYAVFEIIQGYQDDRVSFIESRRVRKSLKTILSELPESDFAMINREIINLSEIRRVEGDAITLSDHSVVYIPRGKVREFKRHFIGYYSKTKEHGQNTEAWI